jgi:hypothetical protein
VVEASGLNSYERLTRLKGIYFLNLNLNDLGAAGAKGTGNPPMRNRAHSDNDIIQLMRGGTLSVATPRMSRRRPLEWYKNPLKVFEPYLSTVAIQSSHRSAVRKAVTTCPKLESYRPLRSTTAQAA